MPGLVTKRALLTNGVQLYRIGGLRLILAMVAAKRGTPFLTVFTKSTR